MHTSWRIGDPGRVAVGRDVVGAALGELDRTDETHPYTVQLEALQRGLDDVRGNLRRIETLLDTLTRTVSLFLILGLVVSVLGGLFLLVKAGG